MRVERTHARESEGYLKRPRCENNEDKYDFERLLSPAREKDIPFREDQGVLPGKFPRSNGHVKYLPRPGRKPGIFPFPVKCFSQPSYRDRLTALVVRGTS